MKRNNKKILSLVLTIAMLLMSMSSLTVFAEVDTFNAEMVTYDGAQFWIDFPSGYTVDAAEYTAESVTVKKVNGGTEIPVTGVSVKVNNKGMNVYCDTSLLEGGEEYAIIFNDEVTANEGTAKFSGVAYCTGYADYEKVVYETGISDQIYSQYLAAGNSTLSYENIGRDSQGGTGDDYAAVITSPTISSGAAVSTVSLGNVDQNAENLVVSFDILKKDLTSEFWLDLQGSGKVAVVRLNHEGKLIFRSALNWFAATNYSANDAVQEMDAYSWYNLKFEYDKLTGNIKYYVGGELKGQSSVSYKTDANSNFPTSIRLVYDAPSDAGDVVAIDNIKVTQKVINEESYTANKTETFDEGTSVFTPSANTQWGQAAVEYVDIEGRGKVLAQKYNGFAERGNDIWHRITGLNQYMNGAVNTVSFDMYMTSDEQIVMTPMTTTGANTFLLSLMHFDDCFYSRNAAEAAVGNKDLLNRLDGTRLQLVSWGLPLMAPLKSGEWNNFRYEFDTVKNQTVTYVNGKVVSIDASHASNIASVDQLFTRFYSGIAAGESEYFYLDNLEVGRMDKEALVSKSRIYSDGRVVLTFSDVINQNTLSAETVKILKNGEAVSYTALGYDADAKTYTLAINNFSGNYNDYSVTVDGAENTATATKVTAYNAKFYSMEEVELTNPVTGISIVNASDEAVASFANGDTLYAALTLDNTANFVPQTVQVSLIAYDNDGRMINAVIDDVDVLAGESKTLTAADNFSINTAGAKTVKAFVWSGWEAITPLIGGDVTTLAQ